MRSSITFRTYRSLTRTNQRRSRWRACTRVHLPITQALQGHIPRNLLPALGPTPAPLGGRKPIGVLLLPRQLLRTHNNNGAPLDPSPSVGEQASDDTPVAYVGMTTAILFFGLESDDSILNGDVTNDHDAFTTTVASFKAHSK